MPLSQADEDFLGEVYRNFLEEPIDPDHPFYVEIWEHSDHDPVVRLGKQIAWAEVQSLQLFTGFNGSGKTTQLRRLQQDLTARGYLVVYADAEDYINLGEPIGIEDLLIVIAGAFSDNLDKHLINESYWDRLTNYLGKTEVGIKEAVFKIPAASFKAELKTSPTFRQRVRKAIRNKLPEVQRQIKAFVQDAVEAVGRKTPGQRVVFLFDSFEKVRGTPSNEQEVMDSVERLFGRRLAMLQLPSVHCVYSVPAYMQFLITNREIVLLPTIKLCKKRIPGFEQVPHEPGLMVMRAIVKRRLGTAENRIFGEPGPNGRPEITELLITASGGALRDLLRLFREALLSAKSVPLTVSDAHRAVANARNAFKTSVEEARWLQKIHEEQAADPPTSKASDVNRYMRLLDSHLILYYQNETSWYDSHPLVREEVERILARNPETKSRAQE